VVAVEIEQAGHPYANLDEPRMVSQLGLELVAKLIVTAWLVMDLLHHIPKPSGLDKVGIASLALPQQLDHLDERSTRSGQRSHVRPSLSCSQIRRYVDS